MQKKTRFQIMMETYNRNRKMISEKSKQEMEAFDAAELKILGVKRARQLKKRKYSEYEQLQPLDFSSKLTKKSLNLNVETQELVRKSTNSNFKINSSEYAGSRAQRIRTEAYDKNSPIESEQGSLFSSQNMCQTAKNIQMYVTNSQPFKKPIQQPNYKKIVIKKERIILMIKKKSTSKQQKKQNSQQRANQTDTTQNTSQEDHVYQQLSKFYNSKYNSPTKPLNILTAINNKKKLNPINDQIQPWQSFVQQAL